MECLHVIFRDFTLIGKRGDNSLCLPSLINHDVCPGQPDHAQKPDILFGKGDQNVLKGLGRQKKLTLVHIGSPHEQIGIVDPLVEFGLLVESLVFGRLVTLLYLGFGSDGVIGDHLGGLIDGPFHIAVYSGVNRFIFVEKYGQCMVEVHHHCALGLFYTPLVAFFSVKVDVIVGGKVVIITG